MPEPRPSLRTYADAEEACLAVGEEIADAIRKHPDGIVLGLATGDTQIPVYKELVRQHEEDQLSLITISFLYYRKFHGKLSSSP